MELIKELNKSPLVTLSQKGLENTIASMWIWQKHNQVTDLEKNWSMQIRYQVGMFYELDALTTKHGMTN